MNITPPNVLPPLWLDGNGLIVQSNMDGGDTAQRMGMFCFLCNVPKQAFYANALKLLCNNGVWIRNPIGYNDPNDTSRDQTDPNIIAMGALGFTDQLKATWDIFIKYNGTYQNGDMPMITTPGLFIRAFRAWWLYPLLLILDFGFVIVALLSALQRDPAQVDDNNCFLRFLQAALYYPTPFSWLGRKLWVLLRPPNQGNSLGEKNNIMAALAWYHRAASGGNPAIAEACRSWVKEYFS